MRLAGRRLRGEALLWFGLLGAPAAWTLQHIAGYALTEASCNEAARAGWDIHLDAWTIALTAGGFLVALAATVAAIGSWRSTRDAGTDPPGARRHFLAIVAVTIAPLFICIMLMSGLGTVFLPACRQS